MDDHKDLKSTEAGDQLAAPRKKPGWSQEKLSLESGIARGYLYGVEREQRNIALVNICWLAERMGIKPGKLMQIENE